MLPTRSKHRNRQGFIKPEPNDDEPASLFPQPPPAAEPKLSLIVKLKLTKARPPPRPGKIVKLKLPRKIVKLKIRPSNLVGVANASNEMRIEAQVEALQRRAREASRPQTRSRIRLPPSISPLRLDTPVLREAMKNTTAPCRLTYGEDDMRGMTPPGLPPPLGTISPGVSRILQSNSPGMSAALVTTDPMRAEAVEQGAFMTPVLGSLSEMAPGLTNLLKLPPSIALAATAKAGKARPRGAFVPPPQQQPQHPRPTDVPPGPPLLYPYGHVPPPEPKETFLKRFARINTACEAEKANNTTWNQLVAESCRQFYEEFPQADDEWMEWKAARRPANWEAEYVE